MEIEEQDEGNGEVVRLDRKEAVVKSVSSGIRTCYEAVDVDERAAYREVQSSASEVKHGAVRRSITPLPGETSLRMPTRASLRTLIPVDSDEESAEVIVVVGKPGTLTRPCKRRDRKPWQP